MSHTHRGFLKRSRYCGGILLSSDVDTWHTSIKNTTFLLQPYLPHAENPVSEIVRSPNRVCFRIFISLFRSRVRFWTMTFFFEIYTWSFLLRIIISTFRLSISLYSKKKEREKWDDTFIRNYCYNCHQGADIVENGIVSCHLEKTGNQLVWCFLLVLCPLCPVLHLISMCLSASWAKELTFGAQYSSSTLIALKLKSASKKLTTNTPAPQPEQAKV